LEAALILQELAPHYLLADCFGGNSDFEGTGFTLFSGGLLGGGSDFAGTGSTFFSNGLFLRQLRFGRHWLHIIYW
jgi:hypothetical protein